MNMDFLLAAAVQLPVNVPIVVEQEKQKSLAIQPHLHH
jgi:hypothetical protein